MYKLLPVEQEIIDDMLKRRPDLEPQVESLIQLHIALINTYDKEGKLLICGNGGSNADAIHIAGELEKSFERKRPISEAFADKIKNFPFGNELTKYLEIGLPAVALGANSALKSAVENDSPLRDIAYAQEAYALIKPEDILLGISTSGNAQNVLMAMSVAKAVGATVISLTGIKDGEMAAFADIAIKAPGDSTKVIQETHLVLYHTFCAMIEAHYFPEMR